MKPSESDFEARLSRVLARVVPGFQRFRSSRRLSGGASQETQRIEVETTAGSLTLAMRRAAGGEDSARAFGRPGLAVEAQLFRVAREAGVPEPEVIGVFDEEDGLGAGFLMEWLEGETLGARIVKAPELDAIRPELARECGKVLARIHGIDAEATGLEKVLATVSTRDFVMRMWRDYQAFDSPQPMIDFTACWLLDHLPEERAPRLVHNDFRNGNLMVTPEGIAAVLDWELAHLGDPVRDLGWICTSSWRFGRRELPVGGFGTLEDLLDGYEAESGERIDPAHVRWWQAFGSFWWAIVSLGMAEAYRSGPDQTVERPAIARRSSEGQVDCANLLIPGPVELVAEGAPVTTLDMPRGDELLASVRDFLRGDAARTLDGRQAFLARVASNSLDIVLREQTHGPAHLAAETVRLRALFDLPLSDDTPLDSLRRRLAAALREGSIALDRPDLAAHLRTTVVNQLAIDQPRYGGLAEALEQRAH